MNRVIKNQKGLSLFEIIVSIAMISIIMVSISSLIMTNQRIRKTLLARESLYDEINNLYQMFNSDPPKAIELVLDFYGSKASQEANNSIIIHYNKSFKPDEFGSYYIKCTLSIEENKYYDFYTFSIDIDNDFDFVINDLVKTRTIKVGK